MKSPRPSWETLNAYIDGELLVPQIKSVEAWMEKDEDIAGQVKQLYSVKEALDASIYKKDAQSINTKEVESACGIQHNPPHQAVTELPKKTSRKVTAKWLTRFGALAASMCLLFVSWQWLYLSNENAADDLGLLVQAQTIHEQWLSLPIKRESIQVQKPRIVAARVNSIGAHTSPLFIPDLSALSLELVDVKPISLQAAASTFTEGLVGGGFHFGYLGSRGCMLSLISWPANNKSQSSLLISGKPGEQAYSWQAGDWHYMVLASRMSSSRRALTAAMLHDITTRQRLPSLPEQQQFLVSHSATPPCHV